MLFARSVDVPRGDVPMQVSGGMLTTQQVVGKSASLMLAERSAGYHSKPHTHDCEQLNYLVKGELWIFLKEQAFHLSPGDFLRIPAGVVHWAWNRGSETCLLVEVHAPPLDILPRDQVVLLLAEGEVPTDIGWVGNAFIAYDECRAERNVAAEGPSEGGGDDSTDGSIPA